MRDKSTLWISRPQAITEAGLVASRWTAAKSGAVLSLWQGAPRWVSRYLGEMLTAHSQSALPAPSGAGRWAHAGPVLDHHFTMGGKLMR